MKALGLAVTTAVSLAITSPAQSTVTAPDVAAPNISDAIDGVEGLDLAGRGQLLIDESWIGSHRVGQSLREISFLRDSGFSKALTSGLADITVTLSVAPHAAVLAAPTLDDNHAANRTTAFVGRVTLPASTSLAARQAAWTNAEDVVTITLQSPWTYPGGTVCIDIDGTPVAGQAAPYWPVEGALDTGSSGAAQTSGQSCGELGQLDISVTHLAPGSTAPFAVEGPIGVSTAFLFGTPIPALDLTLIGSPGCTLQVVPVATLPSAFDRSSQIPGALPRASSVLELDLPNSPAVLSTAMRAQLVALTAPLTTSNGLDFTLASAAPTLGAAYIRAKPGAPRGRVSTTRVPVVRLTLQ